MGRIITIGRQFGSGGRELGRRLAELIGAEYYDKEIITEIARHTSLSEEYVKKLVESKPHSLYPITIGKTIAYVGDYQVTQQQSVYSAQNDIIKDLASKSDCVIVGRCADYILRDMNPFRVFVYADMESRIRRCLERAADTENLTEKDIKRYIKDIDKGRAKYYEFYTGKVWGNMENYDLCINTTNSVIKDIVAGVARMLGA